MEGLRAGGVTLHPLPPGGSHNPKIFIRLLSLIRKIRPDIIQTSLPQMDVLGGAAALTTRVPWVLKESSSAAAYPANWKSRLRSLMAGSADAIVSNSRQGEAYWRSKKTKCPLYVIPNGVSFNETAAAGPAAAADLSLDPAAKTLLFAGRMDGGKILRSLSPPSPSSPKRPLSLRSCAGTARSDRHSKDWPLNWVSSTESSFPGTSRTSGH